MTLEIRVGTDNSETLLDTNSADHLKGKGGNDALKGLAANDTYHFDDGFGEDVLTETASVKVGPSSTMENAVEGMDSDELIGGSAKNTLGGGLGGNDELVDFGGIGGGTLPALAASDDTYTSFTLGTGHDKVLDCGGAADRLDLRPLESSEVRLFGLDQDNNGSNESLRIIINDNDTASVVVFGQFSPLNGGMRTVAWSRSSSLTK